MKDDGKGKVQQAGTGAVAAGRKMPSPPPKAKSAAPEVGKQDGTGRANSANPVATGTGRQKPSPASTPTPRIAAIEVMKDDGKGKVQQAGTAAVAAGSKMPSAAPKIVVSHFGISRIAGLSTPHVRKQDGKGKANSAIAAGSDMSMSVLKPKRLREFRRAHLGKRVRVICQRKAPPKRGLECR